MLLDCALHGRAVQRCRTALTFGEARHFGSLHRASAEECPPQLMTAALACKTYMIDILRRQGTAVVERYQVQPETAAAAIVILTWLIDYFWENCWKGRGVFAVDREKCTYIRREGQAR